MSAADPAIRALREALELSPENLPLRRHLAETLLSQGQAAEAEAEFRRALGQSPGHVGIKVGLARAYEAQGKTSHALVIVEDLTRRPDAPGEAFLLYARLLHAAGDTPHAQAMYRNAVEADPPATDATLAARLGIRPDGRGDQYPDATFSTDEPDEVTDQRVRAAWQEIMGDEGASPSSVERPTTNFSDVGGMESVKDEIRLKIIHPLNHPELYAAYGKKTGGGILLYGPPGCGKTHLARATAGEIQAGFVAVGIHEVLDMWLGKSEQNLHAVFEQARGNPPCVLFFDEVDALAANRTDLRASGGRQLINQFLAETDGLQGSNDGVLILAATNAPWHLDPAFRRPGRFDRILFVPPPDAPARASILRILTRGKPLQDVDFDALAKKTDGCSGADLKAVVDVAVEAKLREAMKAGLPKPITTKDLLAAAGSVKPSTREWFSTARNYALYANQGGIYDDILKYLKL